MTKIYASPVAELKLRPTRRTRCFFAAGIALILAGCSTVSPVASTPVSRAQPEGTIEHAASGMQFPAAVGDFKRAGSLRVYDPAGRDVSVAYNLVSANMAIVVTAYVYPSATLASFGSPPAAGEDAKIRLSPAEFQQCKNEIEHVHPGAQLVGESELPASPSSLSRSGHFARYTFRQEFGDQVIPVESLLYLYCQVGGVWSVKFRITYPAGTDGQPAVDRFLQELKWTIRPSN